MSQTSDDGETQASWIGAYQLGEDKTPMLPTLEIAMEETNTDHVSKSCQDLGEELMKINLFEETYRVPVKDDASCVLKLKRKATKKCKKLSSRKIMIKHLPFIPMLKKYKPLQYLPSDVIAGLTSGVMMIPQSMAFATLASLPPIVGLYVAFFASLTYFFLGTAHQVSWGNVAILSILIGTVLEKVDVSNHAQSHEFKNVATTVGTVVDPSNLTGSNSSFFESSTQVQLGVNVFFDSRGDSLPVDGADFSRDYFESLFNATPPNPVSKDDIGEGGLSTEKKIEVACSVTLVGGITLALLAKLGLGKVTTFISDSLITGFTVGASVHVATSQVKSLLGLSTPSYSGIFKVIKTWVAIFSNIHRSNPATVIVSAVSIIILYVVKRFVNEKFKKKLRVPIPVDLVVVVVGTVVSWLIHLSTTYKVKVVEEIPVGVPRPQFPDPSYGVKFFADAMMIMIVSCAQSVAMAKMMGLKHNYKVNADQELFACGVCSIVSAIFSGYVAGASMSRTLVQDAAGGRSQVASLFAAALVLLVIMLLGPYFYHLPTCILAAIIILSLRSMFLKLLTIPDLWRKSRMDAAVWLVTCISVVILDVEVGLLLGVVVSLVLVLVRSQLHVIDVTGYIRVGSEMGVWRPRDKYYTVAKEVGQDTQVIRVNAPLYFANAELFTNSVFKKTKTNPTILKQIQVKGPDDRDKGKGVKSAGNNNQTDAENGSRASSLEATKVAPFSNLIVDMSGASFVDLMGVQALELLLAEFALVDIKVYIANVTDNALETLQKTGFVKKHGDWIFVTVESALQNTLLCSTSG